MMYSQCSDIDQVLALTDNWNEDNFGALDDFELCAHTYNNEKNHGGKEPLDCMRLLASILDKDYSGRGDISSIAEGVYKRSESYCDCAKSSNELSPPCDSFSHFKVLLHETTDACRALDEIDCPAWSQFSQPCKENMMTQFDTIDFTKSEQCDYARKGCGGVGAFPAFRHLDCGGEISKTSWDFYIAFDRGCGDVQPDPPQENSSSSSTTKVIPPPYKPKPSTPKSFPSGASSPSPDTAATPKKYVPYSASEIKADPSDDVKKSGHGFLKFLAGISVFSVGGLLYKRRRAQNSFDFQRYRRQRKYANDPDVLYSGLTSDSSGPSFEPPTLPEMA